MKAVMRRSTGFHRTPQNCAACAEGCCTPRSLNLPEFSSAESAPDHSLGRPSEAREAQVTPPPADRSAESAKEIGATLLTAERNRFLLSGRVAGRVADGFGVFEFFLTAQITVFV